MPSPMIYQDLTTAALLGHAAQYHSETEIVSVSTGGEKERSCWGEVASRAQRLASALASLGLPPGARCATLAWNNRRHLEIYFAVASGGWVTHTCGEVIVYAWMDRRRENSEKPYGTRLRAGLAVSARLVGK